MGGAFHTADVVLGSVVSVRLVKKKKVVAHSPAVLLSTDREIYRHPAKAWRWRMGDGAWRVGMLAQEEKAAALKIGRRAMPEWWGAKKVRRRGKTP